MSRSPGARRARSSGALEGGAARLRGPANECANEYTITARVRKPSVLGYHTKARIQKATSVPRTKREKMKKRKKEKKKKRGTYSPAFCNSLCALKNSGLMKKSKNKKKVNRHEKKKTRKVLDAHINSVEHNRLWSRDYLRSLFRSLYLLSSVRSLFRNTGNTL